LKSVLSILFIVSALVSCSQKTYVHVDNEYLYGDLTDGLPERDSLVAEYYENGSIKATGRYAVSKEGRLSDLKVGEWIEYWSNGQIKNKGKYKIGSYLNCCIGGLCRNFLFYRYGHWKYYTEDGELKYGIEYIPTKHHINTNCEGGDSVTFGLIKNIPLELQQTLTADKVFDLQKIKVNEGYGASATYVPLNGKMFIEYEIKN
jgi:hypothetical protein